MLETSIPASSRWRFQTAMILAVAADALQVFVLPFFAEGALSPADDLLDLGVAAVLVRLLGWHWSSCQRSLLNLCRVLIWFRFGRLQLRMSIASGSKRQSPKKKLAMSIG